ncbi:protein bcn92 [Orussus abietinus]|uniref:protein bcn92 n=1 Tax=Orussus abietinus TaxID=222816 RepID=UPI0006260302|nr:protein bcn92 [Orussus abietinus]
MGSLRQNVISLYRNLIRESKKWDSYNYRMYALRKVRHEFHQNKSLKDEVLIKDLYESGCTKLETIKRQVIIGNLYSTQPLVIEKRIS